jgi:alpha-L-rhamnosidase
MKTVSTNWRAKWIWHCEDEGQNYNHTVIAKRSVFLPDCSAAVFSFTADSYYRLFINGQWLCDGPCRSWPEHFQYDRIDVATYLKSGINHFSIIARHYGVGDFHSVCKRPGLLAQLDIRTRSGRSMAVISDDKWKIADVKGWIKNTPKISVQMEPLEIFDSRLAQSPRMVPAKVVARALFGPWNDLNVRDVAMMRRTERRPKSFVRAAAVSAQGLNFCLPAARLCHPSLVEANVNTSMACGMVSLLSLPKADTIEVFTEGLAVSIDGKKSRSGKFKLQSGTHLILALSNKVLDLHGKEKTLRFVGGFSGVLRNPINPRHANPWCFVDFSDYKFACNDLDGIWQGTYRGDIQNKIAAYMDRMCELLTKVKDTKTLLRTLGDNLVCMDYDQMFVEDFDWQFKFRREVGRAISDVNNPQGLMNGNGDGTIVKPARGKDIELVYDLGQQCCGYYAFELVCRESFNLDIHGIEYIHEDGTIQHTLTNRNGLRFVAAPGEHKFISLKRRGGRFIFVTLRGLKSDVELRNFRVIEATYPTNYVGAFRCNDERLNRIWQISARTLELCMEDTFTDCPLYEQTLWVGDARNESLFAYDVFGATDIAKRCIKLAAQSLERYPIVGCQVPSSWDCLLPAWSFLWGMSVWDYYWYTGDIELLKHIWPAVKCNLKGAQGLIGDDGLFSGAYWNFFDWTKIDSEHKTVLHNSMLLVGAIQSAKRCAAAIAKKQELPWLRQFEKQLIAAINRTWIQRSHVYPDSIHDNGKPSASICQHTSFLSILYDIVDTKHYQCVLKNIFDPPQNIVRVGSPFALFYLYETLLKLGRPEDVVTAILANYESMLRADATTVWEQFPMQGTSGGFLTRSHCHAWSSAPIYFINRIIIGLIQVQPGGRQYHISPFPCGLKWARGSLATINGPIKIAWEIEGMRFILRWSAPANTKIKFVRNTRLANFELNIQTKPLEQI